MKRTGIMALIALAGLLLAAALLLRAGARPSFNGSRVSNDGEFAMEYTALNATETCEFDLCAGDVIEVSVVRESGRVCVEIAAPGEAPLYRGTDMETAAFEVGVPKDGAYTIAVTGDRARGSVRFLIRSADAEGR